MLATLTPAAAAEAAISKFNHDCRVEGGSNGSYSVGDLVNAIVRRIGQAIITPLFSDTDSKEDLVLIGNRDYQIVLKISPTELLNKRFFGFELANRPLAYMLAMQAKEGHCQNA